MQKKAKMILLGGLAALFLAFLPPLAVSAAGLTDALPGKKQQRLSFYNTHTGEKLSVDYRRGTYPVSTVDKVSHILRDHRSGDSHPINPALLDLLANIQHEIKRRDPGQDVVFHVISGYRSPKSNASLRSAGGGQAKNSRHMHGDAIDIRIPGVDTADIRDIAYCLKAGGVGMYKGSDFVHVDVWKVRTWNWRPDDTTCRKATS